MAYLQVDLTSASTPVRDGFKRLLYIETEVGSDVIICAASPTELTEKLAELQKQAVANDAEYVYPSVMREVSPDATIEGRTVRELFAERMVQVLDEANAA